ncbi:MAG: D-alanyl-D-alanine carboxypeptidase [Clostridia bacterium]|nr:D-alanyl-D-alanine carboxypeptidase [Clostridia bacterium]
MIKNKRGITFLLAGLTCFSALLTLKESKATDVLSKHNYAYHITEIVPAAVKKDARKVLETKAKSAYLMDSATATPIYAHEEEKRLPIASMCKIMTLILTFETIKKGDLSMDEEICISENASSMGGSQVFLESNAKYPVKELIKSIVVCSANDSCVALAEKIAGSESIFVEKMNEKARQLGANNTLFANCTGLPKEPQYSCAKDVAIMLNELTSYEEYFRFGKIWTDKFAHPEGRFTEITNTNRLVRFYDGCDGGKTGFTNQAGFCLAATAKRDNMRVISVVIGEESSDNRFHDVRTMFDYAFANYKVEPVVKEGARISASRSRR